MPVLIGYKSPWRRISAGPAGHPGIPHGGYTVWASGGGNPSVPQNYNDFPSAPLLALNPFLKPLCARSCPVPFPAKAKTYPRNRLNTAPYRKPRTVIRMCTVKALRKRGYGIIQLRAVLSALRLLAESGVYPPLRRSRPRTALHVIEAIVNYRELPRAEKGVLPHYYIPSTTLLQTHTVTGTVPRTAPQRVRGSSAQMPLEDTRPSTQEFTRPTRRRNALHCLFTSYPYSQGLPPIRGAVRLSISFLRAAPQKRKFPACAGFRHLPAQRPFVCILLLSPPFRQGLRFGGAFVVFGEKKKAAAKSATTFRPRKAIPRSRWLR